MSTKLFIYDIDPQLHREFKAACSYFGLSMKHVIVKHMQNIVNDYWKVKRDFGEPEMSKQKWGRK